MCWPWWHFRRAFYRVILYTQKVWKFVLFWSAINRPFTLLMSFPFIFELFIVLLRRALSSLPPPRFSARVCGRLGKGECVPKLPGLGSKAEGCVSLRRPRVRPLGKMFLASNLVKHSDIHLPWYFHGMQWFTSASFLWSIPPPPRPCARPCMHTHTRTHTPCLCL